MKQLNVQDVQEMYIQKTPESTNTFSANLENITMVEPWRVAKLNKLPAWPKKPWYSTAESSF